MKTSQVIHGSLLISSITAALLGLALGRIQAEDLKFADPPRLSLKPTNSVQSNPLGINPGGQSNSLGNLSPVNPAALNHGSPAIMETLDDQHKLAIGDRLSFRIIEDEEDPKPLVVTDSGELEVPYIGRFAALGKTCRELAQALKVELEKDYYYQATVVLAIDLMAKSRGKVYLVGPVRMPGPQEIPSDEVLTLSKAILRAGGFNDFADKRHVKVTRKAGPDRRDEQTFTVDVSEILEKGKMAKDLPLQPGDLIYVPERLVRF